MRLYRTTPAIVIEQNDQYYALKNDHWDAFFNDEDLFKKMQRLCGEVKPTEEAARFVKEQLLPPVQSQELWASGVTYYRSKVGRQEESKNSGGGDFYAKVYEAERPELFFKASAHRIVGSGGLVRIRKDSTWNVPEPELTLAIAASGKIIGYTIGNDMSSRSIEGENPLYLPQAKTYDGSAALGPCILVTENALPSGTSIEIEILRQEKSVFKSSVTIDQIKRKFEDLVSFLYRECSFPNGSLLMTGTGIVPPNDFTLQSGDKICIIIAPIGQLINTVA
jgi:2-dehydro-3-deoxy-D-arabinonate dehydratase